MGSQLDLVGSFFIAGIITLLLFSLNSNITSVAFERSRDLASQEAATNLTRIIEHDFYEMGYRTSGASVARAESIAIKFAADIDDNGVPDTLFYEVGDSTQLAATSNTHDRPLFRRVNADPATNVAAGLVRFLFTYADTGGYKIPYDSLQYQRHRSVIRLIKMYFVVQPADPIDSTFIPVTVQKTVRPKNLGGW